MTYPVPPFGKVSRRFLEDVVLQNLGVHNPSVIVRPGHGFDNAVVSLGGGRVMVATADPLSIIPFLGMKDSAWLTVHLLASDFATSAMKPQFALFDFNLPPELVMEDFKTYLEGLSQECRKLGVAIIGGHTGKYPGCNFTVVGGGVLMGIGDEDDYLTPAMARVGDKIIMTKGAAIATTGILSRAFPNKVGGELGEESLKKAESFFRKASTVKDAIVASSVGVRERGVTSMHDATEGGVLGGLHELSSSSRKAVVVDTEKIFVSPEARSVCSLFELDPLITLSEGTLIITCRKERVEELQESLRKSEIDSFVIGEVRKLAGAGLWVSSRNSPPKPYTPPDFDPYWGAYFKAVNKGWN